MLIKNLGNIFNNKRIDAMMIVRSDNIIEYSAVLSKDHSHLETENVIGMSLFDAYPTLTEETSTHSRVMRTGKPVINEKQITVDFRGRKEVMITSTFPIESNGKIIATFDISKIEPKCPKFHQQKNFANINNIISVSSEMDDLKNKIRKIAVAECPVMVVGESGTGKQLVAESLHSLSPRHNKPFISLNCAAIPENLHESILFGTTKGSFTGAQNKKGVFELADGGTLFLDEANSMSLEIQAKILKSVEEKSYYKVGGEKLISVDVRIISAMNIDPEAAVKNGTFRLDLFYRLGVIKLDIPPLRKRPRDIVLLLDYYLNYYNKAMKRNIVGFSDITKDILYKYPWLGNVRELKNAIEYAFNVDEDDIICQEDLPSNIMNYEPQLTFFDRPNNKMVDVEKEGLSAIVGQYEKGLIENVLKMSKSLNAASSNMKITRQALKYKIDKYGIDYKKILSTRLLETK